MLRRSLFITLFALSTPAFAQIAPAPSGQPEQPAAPPDAPPPAPESALPMASPPPPAPAPLAPEPAPAATEKAAAPAAATSPVNIRLFADSYYSYNTSPVGFTMHPFHRAYARNNGFSLSFLGTDITWDNGKVGATASLRFGPSVPIFYGADNGPLGIDNILQAFGTWHATDKLTLDFGQFGTIYGAEVAESWMNLNYTRGALYFAMQPFWHTGLRATYTLSDELTLRAMVVNGVNNLIDNGDARPSLGVQASYSKEGFLASLGYLGSTDPDVDAYFDHFFDLVASYQKGPVNVILNADLGMDEVMGSNAMFYGASLAAGYRFVDEFGLALRGEYLVDPDGLIWAVGDMNLVTGTFTLDYRPAPNLILRLDNRFEKASQEIFADRDNAGTDTWFQSVLGFVVTSSLL